MTIDRLLPKCIAVPFCRMFIAACLVLAALPVAAQEVGIAARVNGVDISIFRLERYFEDYLKERARNVAAIRNPNAYKRLKREALERLIDRELLVQEASRRAITISPADLANARERLAAGYATHDAFLRRLNDAGFTIDSFDAYLRQDLMAQRVLEELTRGAVPSDTEVRQAYRENRERYIVPELVRARHILLRVEAGASEQARDAVRLRLMELAQQIRNGADFASLARQHSEDSSRQNDGDLGYFPRGKMVPEFEAVAFGLPIGKLSEPVQSPYGWHLIRVEDRQVSRLMAEEEALELVRRQRVASRRSEIERQALLKLRKAGRVELLLPLQ